MQVDYSKLWERYKEKGYKNKTDLISLAALLDEINSIQTNADKENDIMGRVYEYFLTKFALQETLEKEFIIKKLPYKREKLLPIMYKGEKFSKEYYADFVCYDKIIVE